MKKFISLLVALTLTLGMATSTNLVTVKAAEADSPITFADDNSTVTIETNYGPTTYEHIYTFEDDEKNLLETWDVFDYTSVCLQNTSSASSSTETYIFIYPENTEFAIHLREYTDNTAVYGKAFEKGTGLQVEYISVRATDNDVDGVIDECSASRTTSGVCMTLYQLTTYTVEELKTYLLSSMYSTASVKTYNSTEKLGDQWGVIYSEDIFYDITTLENTENSNVEIQGSESGSQSVEIDAELKSVFTVSLPAQITLEYQELEDVYVGDTSTLYDTAKGYFGTVKFGTAGIIGTLEQVFVEPVFPCTVTGATSGETIAVKKVLPASLQEPKTYWNYSEIGSCDFDGINISNCQYSYNNGLQVGFLLNEAPIMEEYTGTITFNFGLYIE